MKRVFGAAIFSLALVISSLALGRAAVAGVEWCEEDPLFVVNGAVLDVTTSFPADQVKSIKGPIEFELLVPINATAAVVALPGRVPSTATIGYVLPAYSGVGGIPVVVRVTVKASAHFETSTRVTGTYATAGGLLTETAPAVGVSTVGGKSNVTTQVEYSLIGP